MDWCRNFLPCLGQMPSISSHSTMEMLRQWSSKYLHRLISITVPKNTFICFDLFGSIIILFNLYHSCRYTNTMTCKGLLLPYAEEHGLVFIGLCTIYHQVFLSLIKQIIWFTRLMFTQATWAIDQTSVWSRFIFTYWMAGIHDWASVELAMVNDGNWSKQRPQYFCFNLLGLSWIKAQISVSFYEKKIKMKSILIFFE